MQSQQEQAERRVSMNWRCRKKTHIHKCSLKSVEKLVLSNCKDVSRNARFLLLTKPCLLCSYDYEKHMQRAGEMLDEKIRKWAYGKEGNLRALLCTLQNVNAIYLLN